MPGERPRACVEQSSPWVHSHRDVGDFWIPTDSSSCSRACVTAGLRTVFPIRNVTGIGRRTRSEVRILTFLAESPNRMNRFVRIAAALNESKIEQQMTFRGCNQNPFVRCDASLPSICFISHWTRNEHRIVRYCNFQLDLSMNGRERETSIRDWSLPDSQLELESPGSRYRVSRKTLSLSQRTRERIARP